MTNFLSHTRPNRARRDDAAAAADREEPWELGPAAPAGAVDLGNPETGAMGCEGSVAGSAVPRASATTQLCNFRRTGHGPEQAPYNP
jgi:hypothetical protein